MNLQQFRMFMLNEFEVRVCFPSTVFVCFPHVVLGTGAIGYDASGEPGVLAI